MSRGRAVAQILLKLPPTLGRAVKKTASERGLFPAEYVRSVLRGDEDPPEIEAEEITPSFEGKPPSVLSELRERTAPAGEDAGDD